MQNAMCLNLNVSSETLVISLRSPFPADSFRQVKYLPHIGNKNVNNSESERNEANSLVRKAASSCFCSFTSQSHWPEILKRNQLFSVRWSSEFLPHTVQMAAAVKYSVCLRLV